MQDALASKTQAVEDLSQEEIRAAFGTEGVQQVDILIRSLDILFWILIISFSSLH